MTSVIYFKLKNAIQQQHVNFDGSVIQIGDVKRLVAQKQGLGPEGATELTLYDPNTGDEYADDAKVIPRNTLVLVKRAPAAKFKPLLAGDAPAAAAPAPAAAAPAEASADAGAAEFGGDFFSEQPTAAVVGEDESRALQSLLQGSAATWQREVRQGAMRGRGRGRGRGMAPPDYRCPRCDAIGAHWLQDCPTHGDAAYDRKRIRPPVGIPMTRLARSEEGGLVLPDGQTGTLVANEDSFAREILGLGLLHGGGSSGAMAAGPSPAYGAVTSTPVHDGSGAQVLALDNKPANEVQLHQAQQQQQALLGGGLALPMLAGEEEMAAAAPAAMPGASFFEIYKRGAAVPRGPPGFIERAFDRSEPLPKSEFYRLQDEYRRRANLPQLRRRSRSPARGDGSKRRRSRSRSRDHGVKDRGGKRSSSRKDRDSERGSRRDHTERVKSSREKEGKGRRHRGVEDDCEERGRKRSHSVEEEGGGGGEKTREGTEQPEADGQAKKEAGAAGPDSGGKKRGGARVEWPNSGGGADAAPKGKKEREKKDKDRHHKKRGRSAERSSKDAAKRDRRWPEHR